MGHFISKKYQYIAEFLFSSQYTYLAPFLIQNYTYTHCALHEISDWPTYLAAELAYFDTSWVETCSTLESLDDVNDDYKALV